MIRWVDWLIAASWFGLAVLDFKDGDGRPIYAICAGINYMFAMYWYREAMK